MRAFDCDMRPAAAPAAAVNVFAYAAASGACGSVYLHCDGDGACVRLQADEARRLALWLAAAADVAERERAAADAAPGGAALSPIDPTREAV